MASTRRKSAAIALAIIGVAGLSLASAAQLNINSASLGAGTHVVASCDTNGVDVGFANGYNATSKEYDTSAVTLANVDSLCNGLAIDITVANAAGTSLASFSGTVGDTYTLSTVVAAKSIENVSVVIHG